MVGCHATCMPNEQQSTPETYAAYFFFTKICHGVVEWYFKPPHWVWCARAGRRAAATRDAAPAGRGVCAVCGAGVGRDPPRPRPRPARARTRGVGPEDTHGRGTAHGTAGQSRPARVGCARQGASHLLPLTFLVSIYVIPLYGFKLRGAGAEAREAAPRRHRNKRRLRLPARARFWRVHVRSPLLHFRPMRPCTLVLRGSAGPGSVVAAGA